MIEQAFLFPAGEVHEQSLASAIEHLELLLPGTVQAQKVDSARAQVTSAVAKAQELALQLQKALERVKQC